MTQAEALSILKTGINVFLTGEPGSGKTHTINQYIFYLRRHGIEPAITASTGIAATHIGGMTIHSWSGIGIKNKLDRRDLHKIANTEYLAKRVGRAKILIIDEISMLTGETLAMVDAVCREVKLSLAPFGGMQVVLVGDFFQLPPIIKNIFGNNGQVSLVEEPKLPFAYGSPAWNRAKLTTCYLTEQHRQDDADFFSLLSAIRNNTFCPDHLEHLKKRKIIAKDSPDGTPVLFSHNIDVDRVNSATLAKIPGDPRIFNMSGQGRRVLLEVLKKGCLSPEILQLKIGASVMFTKNNPREGFVNGTLGTVVGFDGEDNAPVVRIRTGQEIIVKSMDWAMEENGRILAMITQLPLRLAWAITVHKSQGMSMDEAVMDLSQVFEYGQGYVALSRVRRLAGLYIIGWNERSFKVHPEVLSKDNLFRQSSEEVKKEFFAIDPDELLRKQNNFIIACGGELASSERALRVRQGKKKKGETHLETMALWEKEKNISHIAKIRGLKENTILSHLEKLVRKGQINSQEFSCLLSSVLLFTLPQVHAAFAELGHELTPVYEKFSGLYTYEELRIARMMMKK